MLYVVIYIYNFIVMIKKLFSFMLLAFIFLNIANVSAQYTTDTSG